MGEISKGLELFITLSIPAVVSIIFGLLTILGLKYLFQIVFIGLGVIILVLFLFVCISFLQAREKRWKINNDQHNELNNKINGIVEEVNLIKSYAGINEKINKLENQINYIRGRIKK